MSKDTKKTSNELEDEVEKKLEAPGGKDTETAEPEKVTVPPSPATVVGEPDTGSALKQDVITDTERLVKNMSERLYEEESIKFSKHDGGELIFSTLQSGRYPIDGKMLNVVQRKVPTLFKFVSHYDTNLADHTTKTNTADSGPFFPEGTPECIPESVKMIQDGTYSVTLELMPTNYPIDISEESNTQFYEQVIVVHSRTDSETATREYTKRLNQFFRTCRGFNMVVQDTAKNKVSEFETRNPVYRDRTNVFSGDNPHPYLGLIYHPIKWFTDRMDAVVTAAPLDTEESNPISDGGQKVESIIGCVTDQFTAHAINNAKRRLDENILRPEDYVAMVYAHGRPDMIIQPLESLPPLFEKYYAPTRNAWTTTMIRLLMDNGLRNGEILKFVHDLVNTKNFAVNPTAGFFQVISQGVLENYTVIQSIFPSIGVVTPETFCRMLVMEQFAWAYDITFMSGKGIDFDSLVMELLSMLLTYVFFPKLVQSGTASFGYRLMVIMQTLDPVRFNALITNHGAVVQMTGAGRFVTVRQALTVLTPSDVHTGLMYSIFKPAVANDRRVGPHIQAISAMFNVPLQPRRLERKEMAGLPYTRTDFRAYSSWNVDTTDENQKLNNVMRGRVETVITICKNIIRQIQGPRSADRSMVSAKRGAFITLTNHLSNIATTVSSLFFSMESVSEVLQNSYLFVHEGFEDRHRMMRPQWLSLGPYFGAQNVDASMNVREKVTLDCRVGAGVLISVSGGVARPALTTENLQGNYTYEEENKRRDVLALPSESMAQRGLELARDSFRFSEAINILQFLSNRLAADDPILGFSTQFSRYLQMRTFSEIVDTLSSVYSVDLRGVLGDPRIAAKINDLRTETLMLAKVDRYTMAPEVERGTQFGAEIIWTDPLSEDNITMAAGLMLSDTSPALKSSRGLILCAEDREVISPRTLARVPAVVIDYTPERFRFINNERVRGLTFVFPDGREARSPNDNQLNNVRLRVATFGDILPAHAPFIAKSIVKGKLSLEAYEHQYSYRVKYILDNSVALYTDSEAEANMLKLLQAKKGEYLAIEFPDTTYAVKRLRFPTSNLYQTGYMFPIEDIRTNEVITGIYDVTAPTAEFSINDGDQFGIGDEGIYTPISGLPKLNSDVNMNNYIPIYTTDVVFAGVPKIMVQPSDVV
jgi:hypothetical protein